MHQDKSETKEKIYQAVNELYKAEGVKMLTLSNIAEKAGISKGGLLYHFPTKDAILEGLIERNMKEFIDGAEEIISEIQDLEGEALYAKLEEFVDSYINDYLADLESSILGVFAQRPELVEETREIDKKVFKIFMKYFDNEEEVILLLLALQGFFFVKVVEYDFILNGFEERIKKLLADRLKKQIKRSEYERKNESVRD
ncbi:MAG TPA: TetR/AcrR family transcriptional regulator [Thermotogota bacterium]|nr:TetR/AcrR family transcriptional regulator [Thermotogota bacterium]